MKITVCMRYGIKAVVFLAHEYGKGPVSARKISEGQNLSAKYLENIIRSLVIAGIVKSETGKNGGYSLSRRPEKLNLYDVVRAAGGWDDAVFYAKKTGLVSRPGFRILDEIWLTLGKKISNHLKAVSLREMMDTQNKKQCVENSSL